MMQESQAQREHIISSHEEELRKLREIVQKIQELYASAHSGNTNGCEGVVIAK